MTADAGFRQIQDAPSSGKSSLLNDGGKKQQIIQVLHRPILSSWRRPGITVAQISARVGSLFLQGNAALSPPWLLAAALLS
jgi:hypothetical protein